MSHLSRDVQHIFTLRNFPASKRMPKVVKSARTDIGQYYGAGELLFLKRIRITRLTIIGAENQTRWQLRLVATGPINRYPALLLAQEQQPSFQFRAEVDIALRARSFRHPEFKT